MYEQTSSSTLWRGGGEPDVGFSAQAKSKMDGWRCRGRPWSFLNLHHMSTVGPLWRKSPYLTHLCCTRSGGSLSATPENITFSIAFTASRWTYCCFLGCRFRVDWTKTRTETVGGKQQWGVLHVLCFYFRCLNAKIYNNTKIGCWCLWDNQILKRRPADFIFYCWDL